MWFDRLIVCIFDSQDSTCAELLAFLEGVEAHGKHLSAGPAAVDGPGEPPRTIAAEARLLRAALLKLCS